MNGNKTGDGGVGSPRGGLLWKHIIVKQSKQVFFSRPNKQWLFTTAQRGTCKNMLNIYLVQLFSNLDCGNEKGCVRAPCAGTSGYGVKKNNNKKVYMTVWLLLFIFDINRS